MIDVVRKLIFERLQELDLNMSEVSTAIGRNATYLHQFMKRGVPAELHERERIKLAEILKVSENELRGPSTPLAKRSYEKKNEGSRDSLVERTPLSTYAPAGNVGSPTKIVPGSELFGPHNDLPVFGTAQGGQDGALVISDRAVDWVSRPTALLRVQDGYGIIVSGDSMDPVIRSGWTMLVNPHSPARLGDACIFRSHADDGAVNVLVKEYRGQTDTHWKVRQYNPAKDFTLKKTDWQICHRSVGSYFA